MGDGGIKISYRYRHIAGKMVSATDQGFINRRSEFEIPVCRDLVKRYHERKYNEAVPVIDKLSYNPFEHKKTKQFEVGNTGAKHVPVIADLQQIWFNKNSWSGVNRLSLWWNPAINGLFGDAVADYIFCNKQRFWITTGHTEGFAYAGAMDKSCRQGKIFSPDGSCNTWMMLWRNQVPSTSWWLIVIPKVIPLNHWKNIQ